MEIEIANKVIKFEKYELLIDLISELSDTVAFRIPNREKAIEKDSDGENMAEFDGCKKRMAELFEKARIDGEILNSYETDDGCFEVYVLLLSEKVKSFLEKSRSLYRWKYPRRPEDLCFFKNGKCVMKSVTHEKRCFLYVDKRKILNILERGGFRFNVRDGADALVLTGENRVEKMK